MSIHTIKNKFRKAWLTLIYSILKRDHTTLARKLGVRVGEGCRIIPNPIKVFGTEPWLISIGDNVEITGSVSFVSHDGAVWLLRNMIQEYVNADIFGSIHVGNNVFIGICSIILPGVRIGDNVIIGAGSIVTKDLESNGVYAGSPARFVCSIEEYIQKNDSSIVPTKQMTQMEKEQWLRDNRPDLFL